MPFGSFVEDTNNARNPQEVFDLLCRAVRAFGFDRVAFGAISLPRQEEAGITILSPPVELTSPPSLGRDDWASHYFSRGYQRIDPVILLSPRVTSPIVWSRCGELVALSDEQRLIFEEAREAGLHDGLSIPIHGPLGGVYVLSLAGSSDGLDTEIHAPLLRLLGLQFFASYHDRWAQMQPPVEMSDRERDCLLWCARGKTNWDISAILGISEHTVDFHLRKAMTKLGCTSRTVAVVTAIRQGIICP